MSVDFLKGLKDRVENTAEKIAPSKIVEFSSVSDIELAKYMAEIHIELKSLAFEISLDLIKSREASNVLS